MNLEQKFITKKKTELNNISFLKELYPQLCIFDFYIAAYINLVL